MTLNTNFAYQMARWSIIGRLTASLFHEINNPMQAIRGAMGLALEELDDAEMLQTYINLTQQESDRILSLIARARRIYSPELTQIEYLDINHLLQECLAISRKEMQRKNVKVETNWEDGIPSFQGIFGEFSLALLCPLMEISDAMIETGGGKIMIRSFYKDESAFVIITNNDVALPPEGFQLIVCRDVIKSYKGNLAQYEDGENTVVEISIPTGEKHAYAASADSDC